MLNNKQKDNHRYLKHILIIVSLVFGECHFLFAQNVEPWNSKFIVSANGFSDTVWFGCDSLGAFGFQSGLDLLDDSGNTAPLRIISFDSIIQIDSATSQCGNLIRNTIGFDENPLGTVQQGYYPNVYNTEFKFFILMDTATVGAGDSVGLSWDATDFDFSSDLFNLSYASITSENGFFGSVGSGLDWYWLVDDYSSSDPKEFNDSSVTVIVQSPVSVCADQYANYPFISEFRLNVTFNLYDTTSYIQSIDAKEKLGTLVYPNPFDNELLIQFDETKERSVVISDITGKTILQTEVLQSDRIKLDIPPLTNGVYFLQIYDANNTLMGIKKIHRNR